MLPLLLKFWGLKNDSGNRAEYAVDPRLEMSIMSATLDIDGEQVGVAFITIKGQEAFAVLDSDKDVVNRINEARKG